MSGHSEGSITREILTDNEMRQRLTSFGVPANVQTITVGMYAAAAAGEFSNTNPTLKELIGREPISIRQILGETAA